jgi:hypothetical protein
MEGIGLSGEEVGAVPSRFDETEEEEHAAACSGRSGGVVDVAYIVENRRAKR